MKRIAIVQSNYIPWKGYFDMISSVDEFVLYDDVQYTRRDWRNRNKIKTPQGLQWLTIPVDVKGKYSQPINQTRVSDPSWSNRHWKSIKNSYGKAPCFGEYTDSFAELYSSAEKLELLSDINRAFISRINQHLGITTKISWSSDYELAEGKSERLLSICEQAGAATYLSGRAAQGYLDTELFGKAGIGVEWMSYGEYATYPQVHGDFEHAVTVLDVLFHCGERSVDFFKQKTPETN